MDELIAFVRACLDRVEQVARAADGFYDDRDLAAELVEEGFDREVGEQAALHDPASVLADVAAKRAILDLHAPVPSRYVDGRYVENAGQVGDLQCGHCASLCHSETGLRCEEPDAPWPCETVSLLAQAYAGWDGWREEWRL